ncbi:chromosome partitioning protein [Paracoccus thiocyanatus]|uniref:chromosome partitioning protein n=1 Tax=Paracoccus thiocyanatus TaxID=34006 RepID=UPI002163DD77|nr:chromosome partitioning protein [Paracoccus thiocyanatus]
MTPAGQAASQAARGQVSSRFIRQEAALAASDPRHAKLIAQRFSLLRTRILREMRNRGWTRLAVVPVTAGAGGSFVAVKLALALARQPHTKVTLIDLDLGSPGIAAQLGIAGCAPVSAALRDGGDLDALVCQVKEAPNLAVLAPRAGRARGGRAFAGRGAGPGHAAAARQPPAEIAVIDTAGLLGEDAALAALPLADALLLVADGRRGTAGHMAECERLLVGMPPVMGVVLNKSED